MLVDSKTTFMQKVSVYFRIIKVLGNLKKILRSDGKRVSDFFFYF